MRRREFIMTLLGGAVVWPLRPLPCPRDSLCIFPCVRAAAQAADVTLTQRATRPIDLRSNKRRFGA